MRIKQLDLLRAIAVLLVIGRHYDINPLWRRFGWTGVNLFFVLSGFLISGLLFREHQKHGRIRVARFLIRRGFKIYPAFYLFIAWTVVIYLLFGKPLPWGGLAAEMVFVQNYLPGLWIHTWSLAVEEHFYLALPLLLLVLLRLKGKGDDPFRWIPAVYLAVAAIAFALRVLHLTAHPPAADFVLSQTHLVVDALLLGVAISYFRHFRRAAYDRVARGAGFWLLPAGLLLVAPCAMPNAGSGALRFSTEALLLSWGYGAILVAALEWEPSFSGILGRISRSVLDFTAYLGSHSYSVYLWHAAVVVWGLPFMGRVGLLPESRLLQFLIYLVGSFVIGVGMARLIEDPVLRLRDRLFPTLG